MTQAYSRNATYVQGKGEEVEVKRAHVTDTLKELLDAGKGRSIRVKPERRPIVEILLALGVVGALLAPHVAALEAIEFLERHTDLDKLARPSQRWLLGFFGQPSQLGQSRRSLKETLKGGWLGHALHPVLSDVPIGAWTGTLLLDLLWLVNEHEAVAQEADFTLTLGLLATTGTALTGAADWSDLDGAARRVGLLHGLLSGTSALANLASWFLRFRGKRYAGVALSTTSYLASLFSAYLGGELIFIMNPKASISDGSIWSEEPDK